MEMVIVTAGFSDEDRMLLHQNGRRLAEMPPAFICCRLAQLVLP
jgi:hypothetical protein